MKKYYEIEFGTSKDLSDSYSICIIGERKPSIEEAQEFCKTDLRLLGYEHVTDEMFLCPLIIRAAVSVVRYGHDKFSAVL